MLLLWGQTERLLKFADRRLHGLPIGHGGDRMLAYERLKLGHLLDELPRFTCRRLAVARAGLHRIGLLDQQLDVLLRGLFVRLR